MGRQQRSWAEEELRAAVASSNTYREVARTLGLADGSVGYLKRHIGALSISTEHLDARSKQKLAPDDDLIRIVRASRSATDVLKALGLAIVTHNFVRLHRRLKRLNIETSHFRDRRRNGRRRTSWTDDGLRAAVASSQNYAETIRKLGLIPAGGNYDQVRARIRELDLNTSHFRAAASYLVGGSRPVPLEHLLVEDIALGSHALKRRLIAAGLKHADCELCGWAERRLTDGVIPVELDHKNGNKLDNRLENLRILCPNCHALQPTHRGLNKKRVTRACEAMPAWFVDWCARRDSNPHAFRRLILIQMRLASSATRALRP